MYSNLSCSQISCEFNIGDLFSGTGQTNYRENVQAGAENVMSSFAIVRGTN